MRRLILRVASQDEVICKGWVWEFSVIRNSLSKMSVSALALAVLGAGFVEPAAAGTVTTTFNFDGLGNNASAATIASYMSSVLQGLGLGANMVTVSGGIGQQGAGSYAGEGYAVGPKIGGTVDPLTLANTNGAVSPDTNPAQWDSNPPTLSNSNPDGFVKNCTSADSSCTASPDIFFDFHGLQIQSFGTDFQIFPDGSCPSLSNCGGTGNPNLPDLEINSGAGATGTHFGTFYGVAPGAGGTYNDSPNDPLGETAPQLLGTTGTYNVASFTSNPVSSLDFMDWPNTIGLDNLQITFKKTPEPATMAIFVFGLLGLGWTVRLRRPRKSTVA
jgi:hypothetical protein